MFLLEFLLVMRGDNMLSDIPKKIKGKDTDKQILRLGMIAELDAVSLFNIC